MPKKAMKCPFCQSLESKVVDKRESEEDVATRRRRECLKCNKRYTTYERVEVSPLIVVKKDGRRETFERNKLRMGIIKACEKREITTDQIEKLVDGVETDLRSMDMQEIPTRKVGERVMRRLRTLDKVAYIRFASVYRDFTDLESFYDEMKRLLKR